MRPIANRIRRREAEPSYSPPTAVPPCPSRVRFQLRKSQERSRGRKTAFASYKPLHVCLIHGSFPFPQPVKQDRSDGRRIDTLILAEATYGMDAPPSGIRSWWRRKSGRWSTGSRCHLLRIFLGAVSGSCRLTTLQLRARPLSFSVRNMCCRRFFFATSSFLLVCSTIFKQYSV